MYPGPKCLLKELQFVPVLFKAKSLIPLQKASQGGDHSAHSLLLLDALPLTPYPKRESPPAFITRPLVQVPSTLSTLTSVENLHWLIHWLVLGFNHYVVSDSLWPMGYSLPGSSFHGILQARIPEWIAISFSRVSSQPKNWTQVSCIVDRFFSNWSIHYLIIFHWKFTYSEIFI